MFVVNERHMMDIRRDVSADTISKKYVFRGYVQASFSMPFGEYRIFEIFIVGIEVK